MVISKEEAIEKVKEKLRKSYKGLLFSQIWKDKRLAGLHKQTKVRILKKLLRWGEIIRIPEFDERGNRHWRYRIFKEEEESEISSFPHICVKFEIPISIKLKLKNKITK